MRGEKHKHLYFSKVMEYKKCETFSIFIEFAAAIKRHVETPEKSMFSKAESATRFAYFHVGAAAAAVP